MRRVPPSHAPEPSKNALRAWSLRAALTGWAALVGILGLAAAARADVIVLANRTGGPLPVVVRPAAGAARQLALPPGESTPLFIDGRAEVEFMSAGQPKRYRLDANSAYYFGLSADRRGDLQKIGLGEDAATAAGRPLPGSAVTAPPATIPVKILVDEDEPARRNQWERRLRHRIDAASAILDRHCRIRLEVVAVETWNSDNSTTDFFESLAEFEREVKPFPAQLAIGFTSQFQVLRGRVHMAGTRGPLHTHILVREGERRITEPERLEFLVHELGHFLGASHSPELTSVMRPLLGDKLAGRSDFQIRFDPVNTLIMGIVGEEIRRRNIRRLPEMTEASKQRLRQIYGELSKTLPGDPAGNIFVNLVDVATRTPLVDGTREVLQEIVRSAIANRARPVAVAPAPAPTATAAGQTNIAVTLGTAAEAQAAGEPAVRLSGDRLTEYYVRRAAAVARNLPEDSAPRALLLALGIALNDSDLLQTLPNTRAFVMAVEPAAQRAGRLMVIGEPTLLERRDLAKHFAISAYMTALTGPKAADAAGLTKEMLDAQGRSGFSFVDVAANRAGILFAENVLKRRFSPAMIANGFSVAAYFPAIEGLPEGLSATELASQFGKPDDPRFQQQLREVDRRLLTLPLYALPSTPQLILPPSGGLDQLPGAQ